MQLITTNQAKLLKGLPHGYVQGGLCLQPAYRYGSLSTCPDSGLCASTCLASCGRNAFSTAYLARVRRTKMLVDSPNEFFTALRGDLFSLKRKAVRMSTKSRKYKVGFRLNVLSDVAWESVFPTIFSEFDTVQFIDYTKTWGRLFTKLPANYHLTYSVNEKTPPGVVARIYNETNYNCAVVFNTAKGDDLPRFHTIDGITFRVIDGDKHDLRHTDPRRKDGYPCLVGLRYKRAFKLSRGKERGGMVRPKVAKSGTFVILAD